MRLSDADLKNIRSPDPRDPFGTGRIDKLLDHVRHQAHQLDTARKTITILNDELDEFRKPVGAHREIRNPISDRVPLMLRAYSGLLRFASFLGLR